MPSPVPSSEKKNKFAPLLLIAFLTAAFGLLYYSSIDYHKQGAQQVMEREKKEFDYAGRPVQSMAISDQVILEKNKKRDIGRNSLVFRGLAKNKIIVDLYLLEMDPEQPYEKRFSKKEAKKEMVLGEGKYRLLSVNNKHLVLKNLAIE